MLAGSCLESRDGERFYGLAASVTARLWLIEFGTSPQPDVSLDGTFTGNAAHNKPNSCCKAINAGQDGIGRCASCASSSIDISRP